MAKSRMSNDSDVDSDDEGSELQNEPVCIIKPAKTTTHLSILVESLVKNLCSVYEPDEKNARRLYKFICEKLYEVKLIDESYGMVEFEGMRNQYERAFYQLVSSAREDKQPLALHPVWPNTDITNDWSHYYREFEEVEYIAEGGFGQVYRVKHKLDATEYAIKKIFIRSEGITSVRNYLSEVKTFASLNHSNIVQYKAAWLELGAATSKNALKAQENSETVSSYPSLLSHDKEEETAEKNSSSYIYPHAIIQEETSLLDEAMRKSSDFKISFAESECKEYHHMSYELTTAKKNWREKRSSISEGGNAICTFEEIEQIRVRSRHHPKWATLYIQMALCQLTLKQWIEKRNMAEAATQQALVPVKNTLRNETIAGILKQLLRGLEYIHSKGIVHHDIKPSNIFMQIEKGTFLVQLGDFGLACPLQSARHSLAFGTKLYAAPEQLAGNCDPKSDMFSLGIVLLELVESFGTDMERVHNIMELRNGHVASHLQVQQPQLTHIIEQLVAKFPSDRPEAAVLLKQLTEEPVDLDALRSLKIQLAEKEEEIARLKQLLKNAGVESVL